MRHETNSAGGEVMTKLKRHYITNAARNSTEALSMAMQICGDEKYNGQNIKQMQDFVELINSVSVKLRNFCIDCKYIVSSKDQ